MFKLHYPKPGSYRLYHLPLSTANYGIVGGYCLIPLNSDSQPDFQNYDNYFTDMEIDDDQSVISTIYTSASPCPPDHNCSHWKTQCNVTMDLTFPDENWEYIDWDEKSRRMIFKPSGKWISIARNYDLHEISYYWDTRDTGSGGAMSFSSEYRDIRLDGSETRLEECSDSYSVTPTGFHRKGYRNYFRNATLETHSEWDEDVSVPWDYINVDIETVPDVLYQVKQFHKMQREINMFAPSEKGSHNIADATRKAAEGYNQFDLNQLETISGFGWDDLYPKGLSEDLVKELEFLTRNQTMLTHGMGAALKSVSPAETVLRSLYFGSCAYLYMKYIVGNNIKDVAEITRIEYQQDFIKKLKQIQIQSPSFSSIPSLGQTPGYLKFRSQEVDLNPFLDIVMPAAASYVRELRENEDVESPEKYDWRMAEIAKKFVNQQNYLLDSYGGVTDKLSAPYASTVIQYRAGLHAVPGPLMDCHRAAMLSDELGFKFTLKRAVQTLPLEFVWNWFLPIEESIDRIENNSVRLNSLFNVERLCMSTKTITDYDVVAIAGSYYGLRNVSGSYRTVDYHRWSDTEFPTTIFSLSPSTGNPNLSRIAQGGALLISNLGK